MASDRCHFKADQGPCLRCGSTIHSFSALIDALGRIQVKVICETCGYDRLVPHIENQQKATSNLMTKWANNVKLRDNYHCRICGAADGERGQIHAHHIIPKGASEKYRFDVNNGITLCEECHRLVHAGMKTANEQYREVTAKPKPVSTKPLKLDFTALNELANRR